VNKAPESTLTNLADHHAITSLPPESAATASVSKAELQRASAEQATAA
jgi:hypothetical protein